MHGLYHPFRVGEVVAGEFHRVPERIPAPILPVLDNAVHRDAALAVFLQDVHGFPLRLVTLLRLPITVGPSRKHRHVARNLAETGNRTVDRTAIHEVVVHRVSDLALESEAVCIVTHLHGGGVVPEQAVALDADERCKSVADIARMQKRLPAAHVQDSRLVVAKPVDRLVLSERPRLLSANQLEPAPVAVAVDGRPLLDKKNLPLGREKRHCARLSVAADDERLRRVFRRAVDRPRLHLYVLRLRRNGLNKVHWLSAVLCLHDARDVGRIECHLGFGLSTDSDESANDCQRCSCHVHVVVS